MPALRRAVCLSCGVVEQADGLRQEVSRRGREVEDLQAQLQGLEKHAAVLAAEVRGERGEAPHSSSTST